MNNPWSFYLTIEDAYAIMPSLTKLQRARLKSYIENKLPTINPQVHWIHLYVFCFNLIDSRHLVKNPIL